MPIYARFHAAWMVLFAVSSLVLAQEPGVDRPKELAPAVPRSVEETNRREARRLYALGLLCERDNKFLEAVRYFEDAVRLDPEAAPLYQALIPLYLALERTEDATKACQKAVELDPNEFESWYLLGRLQKNQAKPQEAITAFTKALACPNLKDQPDLYVQVGCDLAQMCEDAKNIEGAVAALNKVAEMLEHPVPLLERGPFTRAEVDQKAAEVYERIGNLCLQNQNYDAAVNAYAAAQKKDPELRGRLYYHLAKVRYAQAQYQESLSNLDSYLRSQPQNLEAYELKIKLLKQLGRQPEIVPQLKAHAEGDRYNVGLQLLLARQYFERRQYPEAERIFKSVAKDPPNPEAYRGLFQVYQAQGQIALVLRMLDSALTEATGRDGIPGDATAAASARAMLAVLRDDGELVKAMLPIAIRELGGRRERTHETARLMAVLAARTKQLAAAEELYRQCLNELAPQSEAEVYGGLMDVLWEAHKYEEIVRLCRKGLQEAQATNRLLFHVNQSRALSQLGKYEEAVAEADQAVNVATDDNRVRMRLTRARILSVADRFDQAIAECHALLREATQKEDIRNIRYTLSGVFSAAHQNSKSEEQLRLILQDDPNDDAANNDLGYLMADQNRELDEAERLVRKAIELEREQRRQPAKVGPDADRDHAAYIDSLGWVLFRKGKLEEACHELERATKLPDGEDPVIWDHLGDVYLRMNQVSQARAAWQKSLQFYEQDKRRKLDEQYKELKQKLKLLEQSSQR